MLKAAKKQSDNIEILQAKAKFGTNWSRIVVQNILNNSPSNIL